MIRVTVWTTGEFVEDVSSDGQIEVVIASSTEKPGDDTVPVIGTNYKVRLYGGGSEFNDDDEAAWALANPE